MTDAENRSFLHDCVTFENTRHSNLRAVRGERAGPDRLSDKLQYVTNISIRIMPVILKDQESLSVSWPPFHASDWRAEHVRSVFSVVDACQDPGQTPTSTWKPGRMSWTGKMGTTRLPSCRSIDRAWRQYYPRILPNSTTRMARRQVKF